mgnify:CR=1 FL=1
MNNIGVIGGADGTTQIVVSGSIGGPILWIFFGALALMVILFRRAEGGRAGRRQPVRHL